MRARVASLYSPFHPSVLHLVKLTVDAAKRHGKPVTICGEVAGDLLALPLFIGLGIDQAGQAGLDEWMVVYDQHAPCLGLVVGASRMHTRSPLGRPIGSNCPPGITR
ncbi:MAG: hypothetical protein P8009_09805 [Gammaproteobacteria bacterium]